ncbi:MAG: hypothetical protein IKF42_02070 [Mogibacterium sp.]|nr:hypothetical protein [Mogibacterium sp.]
MKKHIKRTLSLMLVCCLAVAGALAFSTTMTEARSEPKLSAKSLTLAMGGSHKISLKNGNGTWSVQNNGVVRISKKTKKYVKIMPLKSGTATLYCKTGNRKLECKIKVLNDKIGEAETDLGYALVTGQSFSFSYVLPKGVSLEGTSYDQKIGKVTAEAAIDTDTGKTKVTMKIKAINPGRFTLEIAYKNGTEQEYETLNYVFVNGFRGKSQLKKTEANYRKWRRKTISSMASADMSTWEIIDGIGMLISTGKYSNKGGATGIQLWYGGNGTCVSGSQMMNDFLNDLGITSKVHFAGYDGGATDIFGNTAVYGGWHRNVKMSLGGKKYTLNPQPESPWPNGTIKGK